MCSWIAFCGELAGLLELKICQSGLIGVAKLYEMANNVDVHSEILRKQVMVNQMVNAVGCTPEQATTILQRAQWHFEVR